MSRPPLEPDDPRRALEHVAALLRLAPAPPHDAGAARRRRHRGGSGAGVRGAGGLHQSDRLRRAALLHGLAGSARLQLVARSGEGFDERLAVRVRATAGRAGRGWAAAQTGDDRRAAGSRVDAADRHHPECHPARESWGSGNRHRRSSCCSAGWGCRRKWPTAIGVGQGGRVTLLADGRARLAHVRACWPASSRRRPGAGPSRRPCCRSPRRSRAKRGVITQVLVEPRPG